MKFCVMFAVLCASAWADAFNEGQTLFSGNVHVDGLESTEIPASKNPPETNLNDNHKIADALEKERQTNEAFLQIKEANAMRESYDIDVELPEMEKLTDETGVGIDEAMGNPQAQHHLEKGVILKMCRKSGESYTMTCRRQRVVEINVTPPIITYGCSLPAYRKNPGHNHDHGQRFLNKGAAWDFWCDAVPHIHQHKSISITRDEWIGCEELDRLHDLGQAEIVSETLGPENETRVIQGEAITKDYWETTRTYALNTETFNECEALHALGCIQKESICEEFATGMAGERICKRYKLTYACESSSETHVTDRSKLNLRLPPVQTGVANTNMYNALGQMEAMRQMSKHMEGGEPNLRIFKGQDSRCSINFGGSFKNCCTSNGGFGTRMHIGTTCSAEEKNLSEARSKNRCVFVGSRVKKKVLGVVVAKENVFCCYPTKLGFAIQRGARAQLGKDFGSADEPHCEGLTPDELTRVDFSQIDLSATFADIAESAQKMNVEIKTDLAHKQRQFEKPSARASMKENQPQHKRTSDTGERHEIVY